MKAIDAPETAAAKTLLHRFAPGAIFFALFRENIFAVEAIAAMEVTAIVGMSPPPWRSRAGSLVPAFCLIAFFWLAAAGTMIASFW